MTHRFADTADASPVSEHIYGGYGLSREATEGPRSGFGGGVMEVALGWYWLGERIYVPTLRRFLSADRLSPFDEGGWNRYAYCAGDPINRIDPVGSAWDDWLRVGLGVLGALVGVGAGFRPSAAGARAVGKAASTGVTAGNLIVAAARLAETVTVVAAIGSAVSLATENPAMGGVFGWVALSAGAASAGVALGQWSRSGSKRSSAGVRAAEKDSPAWRNPAGQAGRKGLGLLLGHASKFTRFTSSRASSTSMGPELPPFARFAARHDPSTILLASRVPVDVHTVGPVVRHLKNEYPDISRLDLMSGTHGTDDALTNYPRMSPNARRSHPEQEFYFEDLDTVPEREREIQGTVNVIDAGFYTRRDMETALGTPSQEKRILVLNWCYSEKEPALGKYWQFHSYV